MGSSAVINCVYQGHWRTDGHTYSTRVIPDLGIELPRLHLTYCARRQLKYATSENPSMSNTSGFFLISYKCDLCLDILLFCYRRLVVQNFLLQRESNSNPIITMPFLISSHFELPLLPSSYLSSDPLYYVALIT